MTQSSEPKGTGTSGPPGPTLKERLFKGGIWVIAGKVATAGATIVIASVLAKLLPQEQLGAYFLGERLVRYKIPRSFEWVDAPLRDDAGKLRRSALREERLESSEP